MTEIVAEMIDAARQLASAGLVTGAGGNISVRDGDHMWISPSGFSLEDARQEHYPCISVASGDIVAG